VDNKLLPTVHYGFTAVAEETMSMLSEKVVTRLLASGEYGDAVARW
jgi:hypothetical protein